MMTPSIAHYRDDCVYVTTKGTKANLEQGQLEIGRKGSTSTIDDL